MCVKGCQGKSKVMHALNRAAHAIGRADQFIVLCSLLIPPKFFAVSGRLLLIIGLHIINVDSSSF